MADKHMTQLYWLIFKRRGGKKSFWYGDFHITIFTQNKKCLQTGEQALVNSMFETVCITWPFAG